MTNREIIRSALKIRKEILGKKGTMFDIGEVNHMMNMLRDEYEREKMQGVDCYVSWDDGKFESPAISIQKPTMGCKLGGKFYTGLGQNITIPKEDGVKLGVSPGQCKKFRIVEELP